MSLLTALKQRKQCLRSFSLKVLNVTVKTLEAVQRTFLELFCTPKSSMENPSLRGRVSSTNRTFIVEEYGEDDFGQWAKEQGYVDDERSCFWTWDDTEGVWQSKPYKGHQLKEKES